MAQLLEWDATGERFYETGVDQGVLYVPDGAGAYTTGFSWNGLINVSESPTGAEPTPMYADNIKYLNLISREDFTATIEAYTYPTEFEEFDGLASPEVGVLLGQQTRGYFGLSYRTLVGNDQDGNDHGYKLHLIYGAYAAASEKAFATINETPEIVTFSWELSTTPVAVAGYSPTASVTIDSRTADAAKLAAFEDILYGLDTPVQPRLPLPAEVITLMAPV